MSSIILNRSELVAALEQVKGAVAQKNFVPILTHVLIQGDSVLGYDSEVGIRAKLTTKVPEPGFNVRATVFLELVKALSDEEITLDVTTDKIKLKCGSHKSTLSQIAEEYPKPVVKLTASDWVAVPAGFREAIERARIAVSTNENNKILSGLCVVGGRVYGGDGQRAVRCTLEGMNAPLMLLSAKAVTELIRLGNPKRLAVKDGVAVFDFGTLTFLARLRDAANYPHKQFDTLFANRSPVAVPVGLSPALQRLALLNDAETKHVECSFNELGLTLTTQGSLHEGFEMLAPSGSYSRNGINAAYAIPFLEYATSWQPAEGNSPVYFCGETAGFEAALAQSAPLARS